MKVMSKKKTTTVPLEEPGEIRPVLFRPEDARLVPAIEAQAVSERRSRNQMIQILLEEALKARSAWPPAEGD